MALGLTKSLKGRLAAYFAVAITISLLTSGFISVGLVQRYLRQKTVTDLQSQAQSLSRQIETEGLPVRRYIADLEKMYGTRALIIPYREQALGQLPRRTPRGEEAEPTTRVLPFVDWDLIRGGGTQVAETELQGIDKDVVVVAHGFKAGGELAGAVVLAKPVSQLQSWVPLAGWFLAAAAVSLAISLLLAFLLARRLSRPLHEITLAATAVAAGDFSREVGVRSRDEIGRLAEAFRYMADEVQKSQEQQRQFVINVSHELKTPLTSIAGHVQALKDGVAAGPSEVAKSLEVVSSETRRLSRLIEDLLSLAKFDTRQFELKNATVSVGEVVHAVADGFTRQAEERGVGLASRAEPGMKITADPDRLRQILSNLTHNAVVHTPPGGAVSVSARQAGDRVEIEVADTGEGIEAGDLPHVFDRFYRSRRGTREAGLGLGLAISRELARAMGGDITVFSEKGKGSRFVVALPGQAVKTHPSL